VRSHRPSKYKSLDAIPSSEKRILLHIPKGEEDCHICSLVRPEMYKPAPAETLKLQSLTFSVFLFGRFESSHIYNNKN